MRNERKRGCIVAWREADLSLLVATFNETLRPRMCVYCKLLRLVSLKQTDEQGVGLLKIYKTQQKSPSLLIQYAHHMNQNELFLIRMLVLQIAFMHMWFWPCTPRPPLTLWLMVLGWDERPRLTVQQLILLSATFLLRQNETEPLHHSQPCHKTQPQRNNPLIKSVLAGRWIVKLFQQGFI